MVLKDKPNAELFRLYDDDLVLRLYNVKNLYNTSNRLRDYQEILQGYPPSIEAVNLTHLFLLKIRSRCRYTQMIQGFMSWYGQPIDMKTDDRIVHCGDASISKRICIAASRAGLPHIHTHSSRYRFVLELLSNNSYQ